MSEVAADAAYAADVMPLVREASDEWLATWRASLARDGRVMEGGWPGTRAEARALVLGRIGPALTRRGLPFPNAERAARAARDLYTSARKAWLAEAIPERAGT